MKDRFKIRFLAIISIILLCIGITIKELQNDTFYMIRLGEFIDSYGIDFMDHWSWIPNLSYTYPHWLYDLFLFYIYDWFGFDGVYVSTIILFIILIFSIYYVNLKENKNEFMALFVAIISIICLYGFATARAQLISITLFFLEVYFLEKLIVSGKKRYIFVLGLFSFLIANLHATVWLFSFILYLPFIAEHIVSFLQKKGFFQKGLDGSKILIDNITYFKEVMVSLGFSFLMGVFTPSKICYSYIFKTMLGDSQSYILEHAPLVVIQHPCFCVFVVILLLILIFTSIKVHLSELLMIFGLMLMSFVSVRHLSFFYSIGLFYLSRLCMRYLNRKKDKTLDILGSFLVSNKMIYVVTLLLIMIFSFYQFEKNQQNAYVNPKKYPIQASSFIKENLDVSTIRLYNDYDFGAYLMFQDIPVFIDSRCDLYLSEFNHLDYSIFDDAMNFESDYLEKIEFYHITHLLVSKKDIFYSILNGRDNYQVLYQDKYFVLFERLDYE